ncbi:MAG TPA: hypothetical protein VKA68_02280 [bacterium]|nr:hypothetical protein [bacterium]
MSTIGWAEIVIILYLIFPLLLRKRYPGIPWLAFMLGLFNPLGLFYVQKYAIQYFIGLLVFGFLVQYFIEPHINVLFITALPGAFINFYRVKVRHAE